MLNVILNQLQFMFMSKIFDLSKVAMFRVKSDYNFIRVIMVCMYYAEPNQKNT